MARSFAPQQLGKYTLLRKIATGGMAEVFLARSEGAAGFQKTLVIKRILPNLAEDTQFVEMFLNEARVASQLNHPNVVSIYELGELDGSYYIAMEYIDGPNLRGLSRRSQESGKKLDAAVVVKIISMACEGLQYAHDAVGLDGEPLNLIHRDISPDNILVSRQGAVKVVDFGIAKAANQPHLTKSGMLKGKLSYMPPEQIRGHVLDRRADVFALGVCLYELLAGAKPFESTSEVAVMQAILHEPPADIAAVRPDVDPELVKIMERALEKERDRRYGSCQAFQTELDAYLLRKQVNVSARDLARLVDDLMGPAAPISNPSMKAAPGSGPQRAPSAEMLAPKGGTPPSFNAGAATAVNSLIASAVHEDSLIREDSAVRDDGAPPSLVAPAPQRSMRAILVGLGLVGTVLVGGTVLLIARRKPVAPQVIEVPAPVKPVKAAEAKPVKAPEVQPVKVVEVQPAPKPEAARPAVPDPAKPTAAEPAKPVEPEVAKASSEPVKPAAEVKKPREERSHRTRKNRREVASARNPEPNKPLPVQPAATGNGKIEVRVLPYADDVIIDGKHYGQTPLEPVPTVAAGRHRVLLLRAGAKYEQEVTVAAGGTAVVKHRFDQ